MRTPPVRRWIRGARSGSRRDGATSRLHKAPLFGTILARVEEARVRAAGVGPMAGFAGRVVTVAGRLASLLGNAPRGCGGRRAAGRPLTLHPPDGTPVVVERLGPRRHMRGLPARAADRRRSQLPRLRAIAAGGRSPARKPQRPGHRRRRDFGWSWRRRRSPDGRRGWIAWSSRSVAEASSRRASPLRDAVLGRRAEGRALRASCVSGHRHPSAAYEAVRARWRREGPRCLAAADRGHRDVAVGASPTASQGSSTTRLRWRAVAACWPAVGAVRVDEATFEEANASAAT